MCGIAGFLDPAAANSSDEVTTAIARMAGAIVHRGPDDGGVFADPRSGIALANRRLAVVDLSPSGAQPMRSASGRLTIVFNGEIYNHADLRNELIQAGHRPSFRGHSDTETLLEAIDCWGIQMALRRSVGMFALAMWDADLRSLTLARDRIGEKPLYCGWSRGVFLFGSELKALRAHPAWQGEIDSESEALFFRFGYVPSPRSIYSGIGKLPAGSIATLSLAQRCSLPPQPELAFLRDSRRRVGSGLETYWQLSPSPTAERALLDDNASAVGRLDTLLKRTVSRQMLADVPVGTLLSGGIDSSLITALAQVQSASQVKTFTIGFRENAFDESRNAAAVAHHLGTEHTCLTVSPEDALAVVPRLPAVYDEPFADSSQIPMFLVAQLARTRVTAALSGDGGDEVFGGYNRHHWIEATWRRTCRFPAAARRTVAAGLLLVRPQTWEAALSGLARLSPNTFQHRIAGDKVHKLAAVLSASTPLDLYQTLTSVRWPSDDAAPASWPPQIRSLDIGEQIMLLDLLTYLPDDILVKVDRASMAVSLETRAPFLDHEVVEFAWSRPMHQKVVAGKGKWLLRQVLAQYVPPELTERPKMGFGVPIVEWLRGPLREWAESLLTPAKLKRARSLDPKIVQRCWTEHLSRRRNWTEAIWSVLMYHAWLDIYDRSG